MGMSAGYKFARGLAPASFIEEEYPLALAESWLKGESESVDRDDTASADTLRP